MIDRIIDIMESPAYLKVRDELLCLCPSTSSSGSDNTEVTVPLAEVAAVILTHPQITVTRSALSGLASSGAVVVACDERSLPVAMMLPLTAFHAPARRMAAQANAPKPACKRMWQQVVIAKVRAQATTLQQERGNDFGLVDLARQVRSGDPDNIEAQAARIYWPALFNGDPFVRDRILPDQNRYLNYGYAVLRAAVARAICASGLHPGLGIHHHHRNNPYCLADDLMEPFRPIIDEAVVGIVKDYGADAPMDRVVKARLIEPVLARYAADGEKRTLFDILSHLTASVAAVFEGERTQLNLPDIH